MKKLKKSLSVLLTLVMLFTTLCFFPLDFGKVEADAAVSGIKIVVPETLYLTPSTGASTSIQYYINNNADGSVKTSQDTTAEIHITYPGATLTSISAKTSAGITLPTSITGLVGTTFGTGSTKATGTFSLPAGLNAGGTALVEWTFVFTVNGKTQTHYAYSVAYAPWYQPVGAAAKAKGAWHNTFASSILWVSGVHGYSDGDSNSRWYIQTANFIPMLGTIKAPGNNNPDTNWIQSGSNGLSPTINYQGVEAGGVKYHARANSISPTANLTVDTSRYNNFNQIPNFRVGFMVTDREGTNDKGSNQWYVSDFTGQTASYYNGTDTGSSQYTGDWDSAGTKFSEGSDRNTGVKYNSTWNKAISGTASFRIKGAARSEYNATITTTGWNNDFVNISVTGANKGSLRTNVLNGTSYAKENYTADTWNTYYSALKAAATNLCNPTSATVDTSALTTAEANLHTTLTLNANGGAIGDGVPNTVAMNVGAGTSVSFNNADVKDAFYATRTGYTFLGWSTDKNATSAPATVTVGFNDTVYAIWQANKYQVIFDNLIDYPAWNKAAGNGTVSDITDNGFTITSNDGAGESTSESPYFPVTPGKKYKVHMDITGTSWDVYIFFCDADGNWVDFADGPSNRYSTGGSTGVDPENAIFTAPDKAEVVKAKIRVDANGSNNTVRFENIRVFEVDNENADISYEAPIMVTYDQPFGTLPTPTRTGYEFQGWVDENGTPYASSTKVAITETLRLYSTWELGTYTITFDTKGGNAINSISGHYNDPVTKPADPTKDGYLFTGWDKTIPDTIPPENTTITATWSENSYAVFFDGNGQTGGTPNEQINTTYTGEIEIPECTYTKNGYTFSYWTTNKDGTGDKFYPGAIESELTDVRDGSVTLYAQWAVNSYDITYVYDNGTGETKVIPFDINATVNALAAPEKTGYSFAGWKVTSAEGNWELGAVVDEGVTATGMYGNVTLTAQWTVNQYTITFDADGGTAVAPITQDFGTAINEPAAPTKVGYTFAGWENLPATMPAANITVKAIWTVNEYVVEYNANSGEGNVDSQTFKSTDTVTLRDNAFTKKGYHFIGWAETSDGEVKYEGAVSDLPAFTQAAGETITLYAVWEANTYTVTFDKNAVNATSSMDAQGFTYNEAQNLNANAFVNEGYTFVKWNTAPDGSGTSYNDKARIVNLTDAQNGNVTLYAIWEINTYTVTFKFFNSVGEEVIVAREGIEHGTAYSDLDVPTVSEKYYLSTDGKNHYSFTDWGNKVDTITEAVVFTAQYKEEAHTIWEDIEHAKAPDCVNTGIKAEGCDCGYRHQEVLPAEGHSYVEGTNTATCTESGFVTQKCSVCNDTISVATEPLGHKNKEAAKENEVDATCTTAGSYDMVVRCERCNEVQSSVHFTVDATGHTFGDITETVAPGCTTTGNAAYKSCSVCGKFFAADAAVDSTDAKDSAADFVVGAAGHKTVLVEAVAPECEEDGNIAYYTCKNCDLLFSDAAGENVITNIVDPMTGHNYGELIAEVPATCTDNGTVAHYKCSACSKTFDKEKNEITELGISAKGHEYGALIAEVPATCVNEGVKEHYTCSVCNVNFDKDKNVLDSLVIDIDPDNHDLKTVAAKNATCEEIGWAEYKECQREGCGYSTYVEIPATDHNYEGKVTTAATCTDDGVMTYTCLNDANHTYTEVIAAEGHKFTAATVRVAPGCITTGMESYKTCSVCNKFFAADADEFTGTAYDNTDVFVIEQSGHNYVPVVTPPTCEEGGYTTYTCSVCGDSYVAEHVDKLGHTEAVRQENNIGATCTQEGSYDNVTYCTVCGKVLKTENVTGVTLPHTYTQKLVNAEHLKSVATCTKYAVYYYDCEYCTANAKNDAEADNYTFEHETTYDATNHVGTTTTADEDIVAGTCNSEKTWNEVTRCDDCKAIITSVSKTGEKDPSNHVGGTKVEKEDVVPGTCSSEETWNDVTYCLGCNAEISSVPAKGEKNPANHSTTETVLKDEKDANCHETGYTGDLHCADCDAVVKAGTVIAIDASNHDGETEVRVENEVAGTCIAKKTWDDVTYCLGCNKATGEVVARTGEKNPSNHVGGTRVEKEDVVPGTCSSEETWNNVTYCLGCTAEIGSVPAKGEKDPSNHTGTPTKLINDVAATCHSEGYTGDTVYTCCDAPYSKGTVIAKTAHTPAAEAVIENVVKATCTVDGSHEEVIYCTVDECQAVISRTTVTDTAPGHTPKEAVIENDIPATCTVDGSYDEVVYCAVCNEVISRVGKVHTAPGHTPKAPVIENEVKVTCTTDGSYDTVVYCAVCDTEISRETTVEGAPGHKAGEVVYENITPATETENGKRDEVTYCTVCNTELSRETVVLKPVRIITFIMHDETIEIEAHTGDTLTAPEVQSYESADGFIHQFKSWDKELAVVTGAATYTAIYTEPCDYTEIDRLEETLNDILAGGLVDDETLNEYKDKIDDIKAKLEVINANRNTLDKDNQADIDVVVGDLEELVDYIYPDVGSTLEIVGASTFYTGSILDLKAVKMPANAVISDVQWTSSDDNIVFCSNGKLFAIGIGKVTITAKRGILTATKTINVVEGGDVRAINFISMDKAHIIVEDYFTVFNAAGLYWSDANEIRFRVHVYQNFPYETYIVYINGVEAEADADGYYTVPANAGNVRVSIAGAVYKDDADGTGSSGKWSFWEWLLMIFRKIAALFGIEL